jgi:hypothetical protein
MGLSPASYESRVRFYQVVGKVPVGQVLQDVRAVLRSLRQRDMHSVTWSL